MKYLQFSILLLHLVGDSFTAKIIFAAVQLGSHILDQITLGEDLVSRGHNVYMAIGSRYPKIVDIEKKGIKTLKYTIPDDVLYGVSSDLERSMIPLIFSTDSKEAFKSGNFASELSYRDCVYMMEDEQFLEEIRRISFDLAIIEPFILAPCNLILPKFLNISFVSMAAVYVPWKHGIPALPSFAPFLLTWTSLSDITITSRFQNLMTYVFSDSLLGKIAPPNTTLLGKFAPEFNNWFELINHSELFLSTMDHHLGAFVPQMPNYVSVAGLSTSKAKRLPADLENLVEMSNDGIILLSFGSSAYYFPADVIVKFLDAFAKLKQTVLVKFDIPKTATVPANVKALSWLPQNDILGHPKTKLFITHCGNGGQHEALYHGVPMIGFPLFAEQHRNCHRSYRKGFGLTMNIHSFTSDELLQNIEEVLNNPKYRTAIRKASDIFRDQPTHPLERATFWIEHVIRHGGRHLRSFSQDMPLYQFLMLDILGLLFAAAIAVLFIMRLFVTVIYRKFTDPAKLSGLKLKSN